MKRSRGYRPISRPTNQLLAMYQFAIQADKMQDEWERANPTIMAERHAEKMAKIESDAQIVFDHYMNTTNDAALAEKRRQLYIKQNTPKKTGTIIA